MRRSLGFFFTVLIALPLSAQEMRIPEAGPTFLNPRVQDFLKDYGPRYGLGSSSDGRLVYKKPDLDGKVQEHALGEVTAQRLLDMMSGVPSNQVESVMADALNSYLAPKGLLTGRYAAMLFEIGPDGKKRLTQTGRNVLMDILTAEDGLNFSLPSNPPDAKKQKKVSAIAALRAMEKAGVLVLSRLAGGGMDSSAGGLSSAFDGAITQGTYGLESYDWNKRGDPVLIRKARKENQLYLQSVGGTESRPDSEYLRVLIAAKNPVAIDRLLIKEAGEGGAIFSEAGLDAKLLERFGARTVRAVDNLIAVDVPLPQAKGFGTALAEQGIASRPARIFQMAADAIRRGPKWPDPLYSVLPFPSQSDDPEVSPQNAASKDILKAGALHAKGMDGTGSVVAVVDSGLDVTHPDFEDRVAAYIDLTDTGTKDFVGHGTHVAGSIGGSGAASGGRFAGMAPKTKLVILKVFGSEGSTSEDTIIAAMKAAKSLPKEIRPQVMNLSLGGPGDPETDPLSALANEMMVKDNIVMAIAAGNSGPGKKTIGAPGNARYVLTVTGTNKEKKFPFFPSRGPVTTSKGKTYNKPDISTISGDVSATQRLRFWFRKVVGGKAAAEAAGDEPADPGCFYSPGGVISAKSAQDGDAGCALKGNPNYRYMSGTSMATPLAAGIVADVVGYLNSKGKAYKAAEVKALLMETAADLKEKPEVQGAGMIDGEKLAKVLESRVGKGLPVGNVAFTLAQRLSRWDDFNMSRGGRFERTPMGILDKKTGHLIRNDAEFDALAARLDKEYQGLPVYARAWRKVSYWING